MRLHLNIKFQCRQLWGGLCFWTLLPSLLTNSIQVLEHLMQVFWYVYMYITDHTGVRYHARRPAYSANPILLACHEGRGGTDLIPIYNYFLDWHCLLTARVLYFAMMLINSLSTSYLILTVFVKLNIRSTFEMVSFFNFNATTCGCCCCSLSGGTSHVILKTELCLAIVSRIHIGDHVKTMFRSIGQNQPFPLFIFQIH